MVPTLDSMLNSAKVGVTSELSKFFNMTLSSFSGVGLGVVNGPNGIANDFPALVSVGWIPAIIALALFFNKNISYKQKKPIIVLLVIILVSMFIEPLQLVYTMFRPGVGNPYRMSFIVMFILIEMTIMFIKNHKRQERAVLNSISIWFTYFLVLLIIDCFFNGWGLNDIEYQTWIINLIALTISGFITYQVLYRESYLWKSITILITLIQLGFAWALDNRGQAVSTLDDIPQNTSNLERYNTGYISADKSINSATNGLNNSFFNGKYATSSYTSALGKEMNILSSSFGLYHNVPHTFSILGETSLVSMLFNVTQDPKFNGSEFEGMSWDVGKGGALLLNSKADTMSGNQFENQNVVARALGGENLFTTQEAQNVKKTKHVYEAEFRMNTSGWMFLQIPTDWPELQRKKNYKITINDEALGYRPEAPRLLSVQNVKKGEVIKIKITSKFDNTWSNVGVAVWNTPAFNVMRRSVRANNVDVSKGYHLKTTMATSKSDKYLMLSVPYNKNWRVKVNGKRVETYSVAGGFLGVKLNKGSNTIMATYYAPSLVWGAIVSVIGISLNILVDHLESRKQLLQRQNQIRKNYRRKGGSK